jgi:hypothetical protein
MSKTVTFDKSSLEKQVFKLQSKNTKGFNQTIHGPEAWRKKMVIVCMVLYPKVAKVLRDLVPLDDLDAPDRPEDLEDAFAMDEYKIDLREYKQELKDRREQSREMVAYLASYTEDDVYSTSRTKYPEFDTEGDIVKTYCTIRDAALCVTTLDKYQQMALCDDARLHFKQTAGERFRTIEGIIEAYVTEVRGTFREHGMEAIPEQDEVRDVIEALPPALASYRAAKHNENTRVLNLPERTADQRAKKELDLQTVYPENLQALFAEISSYQIYTIDRSGKPISANFATLCAMGIDKVHEETAKVVNFVTEAAENKENYKPRNAGRGKPSGKSDENCDPESKESTFDLSKPAPRPCNCCGQAYGADADNPGMWHWRQNCEVYKKRVSERKAAEKSKHKSERKREKTNLATRGDPTAVVLGDPGINYSTLAQSTKDIFEHAQNSATASPKENFLLYYDTCCNAGMYCNPNLLSNVRNGDRSMDVKTGSGIYRVEQVGDSMFEGNVIYNPNSPGNIGCAHDLQRRFKVKPVEKEIAPGHTIIVAYVMHLPQFNYDVVYKLDGKVFVADLRELYQKFPNLSMHKPPEPVPESIAVTTDDIERALGRKLLTIESAGVNIAAKPEPEAKNFEPVITTYEPRDKEDGVPQLTMKKVAEIESPGGEHGEDQENTDFFRAHSPIPRTDSHLLYQAPDFRSADVAAEREGVGVHFFPRHGTTRKPTRKSFFKFDVEPPPLNKITLMVANNTKLGDDPYASIGVKKHQDAAIDEYSYG